MIIAEATNCNLEEEVKKGNFRKDLFPRLNVIPLTIPPIRQRREDIPVLAHHFISLFRYKIGRKAVTISAPAMRALYNYDWPGNVRELMNVIERAMLLCKGDSISIHDLPYILHQDY
jgi:two-component system response regulator AtoC